MKRQRLLRVAFVTMLAMMLSGASAFATTFYVDATNGNDVNSGLSWTLAKKTIQAAVNDAASGDAIKIAGGAAAAAVYDERVVVTDKTLTLEGKQDNTSTAVPNESNFATIIRPSTNSASNTEASLLSWSGLPSTSFDAVVYGNFSTNTYSLNIYGLTIDANQLSNGTRLCTGLSIKNGNGTIGDASRRVTVTGARVSGALSGSTYNGGFNIMLFGKSQAMVQHTSIDNYQTAGILVAGNSTSTLASTIANQPKPTIQDCIITGQNRNNASGYITSVLSVHGGRGIMKRTLTYRNYNGVAYSAGAERLSYGYGVYLSDARDWTVGSLTLKGDGNLITENEIGVFVELTVAPTIISPGVYQFQKNNIYRNGYNGTTSTSSTGQYLSPCACSYVTTTMGAVRYRNAGTTASSALSMSSNAWGNADANTMFTKSTPAYTPANYDAMGVALWQETTGDAISASAPLATTVDWVDTLAFNPAYVPLTGLTVNFNYGYSQFPTLNDAVAAASAISEVSIEVPDSATYVLLEPLVITKKINVYGQSACNGTPAATMATLQLAAGVCGPTVWVQGMSTTATPPDPLTRTPDDVDINDFYVIPRSGGGAAGTYNWGFAFTGANNAGLSSPTNTQVKGVKVSSGFSGGLFAMVTDIDISADGACERISSGATPSTRDIDAKITYVDDCDITSLTNTDVYDHDDEPGIIARIIFDNTIFVANCAELQAALDLAASDPSGQTPMNIVSITMTLINNNCTANYNVNGGGNVVLSGDGVTGIMSFDPAFPMQINSGSSNTGIFTTNEATYPGGTAQACHLVRGPNVTIAMVHVWPPACLQTAVNVVTPSNSNIVIAATGNGTTDPLAFVESGANEVTINKNFDLMGGDNIMTVSGNATFTGKFVLNTGADVHMSVGTVTSTRGAAFADGSDQVDLNFTNGALTNYTAYSSDAINMALQFVGTSGSRGLNLTQASYATETPTLDKRVHLHGLASRGSSTGTITLNGSGNCTNPSLINNVNVAQILVSSDADCIQTALGTAGANQATEGVGTNATNGSGGTIDLNNVADWTQGMDIGKSVTFTNETEGTPANNGTVILRRGADVLSGLTDFTNTVNLTQDASWSTAANPFPQQGVTIVNTNGTVNVAGYGRGTAVGTGSAAGGPWAFYDIDINKACTVQGFYSSTCASNPVNCTAADPAVVPPLMTGRGGALETVVGFNSVGGLNPGGSTPIFRISASNVTLRGFYFDNIRGTADRFTITSNTAGYNGGTITNNILDGTGGGTLQYGFLGFQIAQTRQDWTVSCNRMFGANSGISSANNGQFVWWINNNASTRSTTGSVISNNVVLTDNGFHQVLLTDVNNGANATYMQVTDNFFSTNAVAGPVSGGSVTLTQTAADRLQGVQVLRNVVQKRDAGVYFQFGAFASATPNVTVANNFITGNTRGVWFEGVDTYTPVTTANEVRINNNYISGNTTAGVAIVNGTTAGTTGKIDISVNWWGGSANLGPTRGANVTAAVQPFTSANGNQIAQNAVGAGDIFTNVLPFFVSGVDQTLTDCGWTGGPLIGPVLRMATGGSALLGIYPTITCARDNSNTGGCSSATIINATRTNTDEIWVIGEGGTGAGATKYPSATSPEAAYPVVFSADPQPSTVLGINGAIIRHTGTGALQSTTRTNGFTVSTLTFDDQSTGTHTAVDLNSGNATINACTFNSATASGSYTAIKVQGASSVVNIGNTTANTITYTGSVGSTGIHVNTGFTSGTIARNTITGIFNSVPSSSGGASIYVGSGNSGITIGGTGAGNTIQGSASNGSNGIVLDATSSTITVNSNSIATTTALRSTNTTGISAGGFGILVYANNGTSAIGNISITNNIIGGTTGTGSVDQAGIFVGGTTGAIGGISIGNSIAGGNTIRGVRDGVGTAAASNAAVAIATFGGTPASGQIDVTWNNIGGTGANEGNKVDLLIGNGTSANNLSVQVQSNNFRDDAQVIDATDVSVRDNRTLAGTNIRNIFGNPNGTTNTGTVTAGQGQSGNNTFSHAAILTSSTNLQDYASATVRTANAVAIGGVTAIYRRAQTPMSSQTNTDNTVELRENAGMTAAATAASYFNESLTFNDCRCMLLGPTTSATNVMTNITSHANIFAGTAGVDLISNGRENKDVRGGITLHAIGGAAGATSATGIYGRIPTGAANKGDVYLQGAAVGADNGLVKFAYHATTLGSQTEKTGIGAETTGANDLTNRDAGNIIKAGIEDANDDAYAITNNQARRTGVFHRGNGTQFTKPTEDPITGDVTGIFPNPAANEATLRFAVPASGTVAISVYNALGIKVMDFTPETKAAGVYTLDMSTAQLPSGSYTVSISNTVPGFNEPMTITAPLQIVR